MIREIKFRAWEKNIKEIIHVSNIDFVNRMINTESAWRIFDEIELMQYTGLKDKNGKEIYEGDLVKNESGRIAKVYWFDVGNQGQWDKMAVNDKGYVHRYDRWDRWEIIGNIYENPELLEGC